jgi:hypothetical protein
MLVAIQADIQLVVHRALITCAYVCCGLVLASFAFFVNDQASGASQHQVAEITSPSPGPSTPGPAHYKQPRRFIESAGRVLDYPFHAFFHRGSIWGQELFETFAALLLYGMGFSYLARFSSGWS